MKTQNLTILLFLLAGLAPLPAEDGNDRPRLFGKFTRTFTETDEKADPIDYISEVQECYKGVLDIKDAASAQAGAKGLCDKLQKLAELLKQRQEAIIESMHHINNYPFGIEDDEIAARLLLIRAHMQWLAKQEPAYFGCADLGATWDSTLAGQVPDAPRHADEPYTTDSPEVIHITQPPPGLYTFEDATRERMNAELSALVMAIRGKDVIALRELAPFIHAYRAHVVDPECYYITHVSPAKDSRKFVTGQTLLYEALDTLDKDVLEAVLDAGVDPNAYIPMGCHIDAHEPYSIRPIHLMAIHPEAWVPVPYSDHKQSVKNMEELIKILQAHGADINATDDEGRTALHYAAGNHPIDPAVQAEDVMDMLIRLGAAPADKDNSGRTAEDCLFDWEEE